VSEPFTMERRIDAPPARVYAYLIDSGRWASWQGVDATIEAAPGGTFEMLSPNGMTARGEFLALVPERMVRFTWGWEGHPDVPPGSTTVEIELVPDGDATLVRLTHSGLPGGEVPIHVAGWEHYLARLGLRAAGGDPGPDPGLGG
jgi:uncharacterized protein YndB with AHSA1/START domain